MILRLFKLRTEVFVFPSEQLHPLAAMFEDGEWVACLAYLADVFTKLNNLNLSLKGKDSHLLHMYDKLNGYIKKIKLWERKCENGDVSCFPLFDAHLASTDVDRNRVVKMVKAHLYKLDTDFNQYFHAIEAKSEKLDWVRNSFRVNESSSLSARLQENLTDLSSEHGLKMAHTEKSLTEFCCDLDKEYPELEKCGLKEHLPFESTNMCEVTLSALSNIKTKQRNRLNSATNYPNISILLNA